MLNLQRYKQLYIANNNVCVNVSRACRHVANVRCNSFTYGYLLVSPSSVSSPHGVRYSSILDSIFWSDSVQLLFAFHDVHDIFTITSGTIRPEDGNEESRQRWSRFPNLCGRILTRRNVVLPSVRPSVSEPFVRPTVRSYVRLYVRPLVRPFVRQSVSGPLVHSTVRPFVRPSSRPSISPFAIPQHFD